MKINNLTFSPKLIRFSCKISNTILISFDYICFHCMLKYKLVEMRF